MDNNEIEKRLNDVLSDLDWQTTALVEAANKAGTSAASLESEDGWYPHLDLLVAKSNTLLALVQLSANKPKITNHITVENTPRKVLHSRYISDGKSLCEIWPVIRPNEARMGTITLGPYVECPTCFRAQKYMSGLKRD